MAVCDVSSDPGIAGPSMKQEVQHYHQLWSGVPPPPKAFMPFAQEKRRSVAAEKLNEDNQRVSSRLGKLWRSFCAIDKGPYQRNEAEAAAAQRRRYPYYVFDQRGAHKRGEHGHRISPGMSLPGSVPDVQLKRSSSSALPRAPSRAEADRSCSIHPPLSPPPQRCNCRATSATLDRVSGADQWTPYPGLLATPWSQRRLARL
ncbi:transcription factor SOX-18-like [Rhipicephalus sanguineus]|uniref:transcription factor SOX-18-like n=1 Tax=Rhipicephalus sanguineus TaxID=34632 RepID=UPI001893082C|nr:transcription factor SOX-18-like [Rhipicephalus sanguineus]